MSFRKFKGDYLFDGCKFLDSKTVLITDEKGVVDSIVPLADAGEGIQEFNGILAPGLINCHCHLELSHLKNAIPPGTGLVAFLKSVVQKRNFPPDVVQENIQKAEREMFENGIVAVGDICNQVDAISTKKNSRIRWQSFVEVLSPSDETADANVDHYKQVLASHVRQLPLPHRSVLVPHAPYTISKKSFELINDATANELISIHNQEHPAENELYETGGGEFMEFLKIFGFNSSPFPVTGRSSLKSYLPYFTKSQKIILVHNTFIQEDDIQYAQHYALENNLAIVICLCPNANLYIEGKLPPIEKLVTNNCHIVLGTDSYSSNWQLSIAKEMESLMKMDYFKKMDRLSALEVLLQWATSSGARALGWEDDLGTFKKGKTPGIAVINEDLSGSRKIL
jgi:cytosine/adenosine deaminase-related metal-dependent hydrolase